MEAEEFFDLSNDLFCITGTDGLLKKVNNAFCKTLGYITSELQTKSIYDIIHPEDINSTKAAFDNLSSTKEYLENRCRCSDGKYLWISWSSTFISDHNSIFSVGRDISKEKQFEERISGAFSENQLILDSSLDIICSLDIHGKFRTVSKASEALLGYLPQEIIGRHYSDFVYADDVEITDEVIQSIINGAEITNFQNRYNRKDHTLVTLVWSARWSPGEQVMFCIGRNATAKLKYEEQLAFNEKRLQSLLQSGSDLISIINPDGTYQYVSPTVEQLGYNLDFLIGKSPFDFIHPDDVGSLYKAFETIAVQKQLEIPLFRFKDAKGEWRFITSVVSNMIDNPAINGIVVNSRDVTEIIINRREKVSAIQRTNNLIENFTEGFVLLNAEGVILDLNLKAAELLNGTPGSLKNTLLLDQFSESKKRSFLKFHKKALTENCISRFEEYCEKSNRWYEITVYPNQEDLSIFFKNITYFKVQELTLKLEKDVLEMITKSSYCLKSVVDYYLEGLATIYPAIKCAVQLVKGDLLFPLSSPSLPDGYRQLLENGIPISEDSGSCGAAAYLKNNVIIEDILTHPNYALYKDVILQYGIRSCWSLPVINEEQNVVATLVAYHPEVKEPDETEMDVIKRVSTILNIVIESHKTKESLQMSSERYRLVTLASKDAIYDWDILKNNLHWGEGFAKIFGYKETLTTVEWWANCIHPEDQEEINTSLEIALDDYEKKYWHAEYRFLKADDSWAYIVEDGYIIRDTTGKAIRMVGAMQDHTTLYEHQYQVLKQNNALRDIAQINSHYIRKPLANILGLILTIKSAESTEIDELIQLLEISGFELDEITREIAKKTYS